MKTLIYSILLVFLSASFNTLFAQNDKDAAVILFAGALCECMEPQAENFDRDVKRALILMPTETEEEVSVYLAELDDDLYYRLDDQVIDFIDYMDTYEFDECFDQIEEEMAIFEGKLEDEYMDGDQFMYDVIDELNSSSECAVTHAVLSLISLAPEE